MFEIIGFSKAKSNCEMERCFQKKYIVQIDLFIQKITNRSKLIFALLNSVIKCQSNYKFTFKFSIFIQRM
ncbi:unnamed protein product [Paramecium octaurelia]|uniref:Uncharacterized protein n=1 Tax=Paramecium octaurelia TaxID=43137 RepID=A0A8S1YDM4_PAROT|nr:unnamed protein product [Paramecium octaurelia]